MNSISRIRARLAVTQSALADGIGVSQGNISHYEQGQTVPPEAARRLITFAKSLGVTLTFDDVYAGPEEPVIAKLKFSPEIKKPPTKRGSCGD